MSRSKSSLIYFPPSLVLKRDDGDIGFVFLLLRELHGAVYEGVESVVLTNSDVLVRIVDGSPLPYDDVTGLNDLTAEFLESKSLGMGLTAVL